MVREGVRVVFWPFPGGNMSSGLNSFSLLLLLNYATDQNDIRRPDVLTYGKRQQGMGICAVWLQVTGA